MTDNGIKRSERVLDQLRNHRLPAEWKRELGCVDDDSVLLFTWLDVLSRCVHTAHMQEVRREGLAYSEAKLIYQLLLEGPPYHQSPTRLNDNLELTSGGVTKTVDRLEARGFVQRLPDVDDGRSIKVGLTQAGVEAAQRVGRAFSDRYDQLVGTLGADERKRAVKTLRTLLDAFDRPL